jgi:hypothetical protein
MSKWLVISNCQTRGLTASLSLQAPGIEVEGCEILAYRKERDHWTARLPDFSKIVINSQFEAELKSDCAGLDTIIVPPIYFPGYHPDETVLLVDGALISSSIGVYHSLIAFSAYGKGMSVAETLALYRQETYDALDYLGWWSRWHQFLLKEFSDLDMDISTAVNRWSLGRPFMYTSHHPKVECLFDVSKVVLEKSGITPQLPNCFPEDHLISDTCFPVYSEIAAGLGFKGSYQFKPGWGRYRCVDLETFIAQSFAIYETHDLAQITVEETRQPLFEVLAGL